MEQEDVIKFYEEKDIKKIIKSKETLYYADDGMYEVIVREQDIPDYIVKANELGGETENLKFYKVGENTMDPKLTTIGRFLDRADPKLREKIIDRLVELQTTDTKPNSFKVIDEDMYEEIQIKYGFSSKFEEKNNEEENKEQEEYKSKNKNKKKDKEAKEEMEVKINKDIREIQESQFLENSIK